MSLTPNASIVVPVCNEAAILPLTVPKLLASAHEIGARIVWVCNGCSDNSAEVVRSLTAGVLNTLVIEVPAQGKALALQAGDDLYGELFPRFYIDADIWLQPGDLARLCAELKEGHADLVGPCHDFDYSHATRVSAGIARCWLSLPMGGQFAILGVMGVSRAGRAYWKRWPLILGDDIFVSAVLPPERTRRVPGTVATTRAPADFAGWVRMRARWRAGERQLVAMGLPIPSHTDQRRILVRRVLHGPHRTGALAFIAARLAADWLRPRVKEAGWTPDRRK